MGPYSLVKVHSCRCLFLFPLFSFLICACTVPPGFLKKESAVGGIPQRAQVLVMPPDIQIFEITAGGLPEPKADWTQFANANVKSALNEVLKLKKATMLTYQAPDSPDAAHAHNQIVKLHAMVGNAIIIHKYIEGFQLPTKADEFDWGLGEGARQLNQGNDADYALFLYLRDSHASAGRVAFIAAVAVLGVYAPGGTQQGFASLVDLRSGDIIWFKRLFRQSGDLRNFGGAMETVTILLDGLPL